MVRGSLANRLQRAQGPAAIRRRCTCCPRPSTTQPAAPPSLLSYPARLFALGVLCYLDRTNLSFAALELNQDLGLSCSTYGLGAALFFVSYALFQM